MAPCVAAVRERCRRLWCCFLESPTLLLLKYNLNAQSPPSSWQHFHSTSVLLLSSRPSHSRHLRRRLLHTSPDVSMRQLR